MEKEQTSEEAPAFTIHPDAHIGHIHLRVSNIPEALSYYRDLLGFQPYGKPTGENAFLTVEGIQPYLIALTKAHEPRTFSRHAGLYHFAILLPERKSLARILRHLMKHIEQANFQGASDHGVSEALYLQDPDGNGIEIYRDRPRDEWRWSNGELEMSTKSLEEEDLLKESKEDWQGMPEGSRIGHIHLQVSNLQRTHQFYSGALGLKRTTTYPGASFYAAGEYHHHIGTNIWAGEGITPNPTTQPGLDHFAFVLPNAEALHHLLRNLSWRAITTDKAAEEEFSHSVYIHDPDGIKVQLHIP